MTHRVHLTLDTGGIWRMHWAIANAPLPMKHFIHCMVRGYAVVTAAFLFANPAAVTLHAQAPAAPGAGAAPEPLNWTTQQDHRNMMEQLGITRLRPGPSGRTGRTNSANYDPAKANPFLDL